MTYKYNQKIESAIPKKSFGQTLVANPFLLIGLLGIECLAYIIWVGGAFFSSILYLYYGPSDEIRYGSEILSYVTLASPCLLVLAIIEAIRPWTKKPKPSLRVLNIGKQLVFQTNFILSILLIVISLNAKLNRYGGGGFSFQDDIRNYQHNFLFLQVFLGSLMFLVSRYDLIFDKNIYSGFTNYAIWLFECLQWFCCFLLLGGVIVLRVVFCPPGTLAIVDIVKSLPLVMASRGDLRFITMPRVEDSSRILYFNMLDVIATYFNISLISIVILILAELFKSFVLHGVSLNGLSQFMRNKRTILFLFLLAIYYLAANTSSVTIDRSIEPSLNLIHALIAGGIVTLFIVIWFLTYKKPVRVLSLTTNDMGSS